MQKIINMLELIIADSTNRERLVRDFQKRTGNNLFTASEDATKIFDDLAYTMENYEPDEEVREEDTSLYSDDRLIKEIEKALIKLKKAK
jgi:hypothetical protein